MIQQQERSPFTTEGKSLKNNFLHAGYICVHHEGILNLQNPSLSQRQEIFSRI